MRNCGWRQKTIGTLIGMLTPFGCHINWGRQSAADEVEQLKQRLEQMNKEMQSVQQKLDDLEKQSQAKEETMEELDDRLNKTELHTATDKVAFGIEFRTRGRLACTTTDIQMAPASLTNMFFADYPAGFNGATLAQAQAAMAGMVPGRHDSPHGNL